MKRLLPILLLAGCASSPPRDVYVYWPDNPCSDKQITRVRFHNTPLPVLGCVQRANEAGAHGEASQMVLLTLLGFPPAACTVYWGNAYAEIYAPIADNQIAQFVSIALSAGNARPETVLIDELSHAVGDDHGECRP